MSDIVLTEVHGGIATITLNRPDARNALSSDLIRALRSAVRDADANDDVSVLVLTGADPAFCAGLDLKELGAGGSGLADSGATGDAPRAERGALPPTAKPVIGAVNGAAITGGFEIALNCDFLVASDRARFADTHARVGIQPGWGLTVLLPQAIGVRRAREHAAKADLILWIQDVNRGLPHQSPPDGPPTWNVWNKIDLRTNTNKEAIRNEFVLSDLEFYVSAKDGLGFDALLGHLAKYAASYFGAEPALVSRERHRKMLEIAQAALGDALAEGERGREDIVAEELRRASNTLGRLTGRIDVEDILDVIFRDFCIGK